MSFQQGLVVIVISIKCLYIYFLRNSTNFRHPHSFEKFQSYWRKAIAIAVKGDGSDWGRLLFKKNYLFRKKKTFFQPQTMASPPPQLRWGHWRGWQEIWQKGRNWQFFQNCPLSIILLGCHHAHHHIHSSLSLQKETEKPLYLIRGQISPLLQCLH